MIQKEIMKNEEINKNKDEKELQSNIKNIVFSQVFSYSNNMIEFNINKEDINKIVDDIISMVEKFCREFEIDTAMVDSIVENVNNMTNNKIIRKEKEKEEEEKIKKLEEEKNKDNPQGQLYYLILYLYFFLR